jgi:predicted TIM-barrel fold metal-dependent hydrolase
MFAKPGFWRAIQGQSHLSGFLNGSILTEMTMSERAWDLTIQPAAPVALESLPAFLNETLDVDSHEMIPMQLWPEYFGEAGELMQPMGRFSGGLIQRTMSRPGLDHDDAEFDPRAIWLVKGPEAPAAIDHMRRPAVLDAMGVRTQFVFPSFGLMGLMLLYSPKAHEFLGYDPAELDRLQVGRKVVHAHNRWAARVTHEVPQGRVRPVAIVVPDTVQGMLSQAQELIDGGVRALWLPAGLPPADTSPADCALDPFWKLAAEHDVPVVLHLGTEFGLLASSRWNANVPAFNAGNLASHEFPVEPYRGATLQLTCINFLTAAVLGGVFERHPRLRFGVIECGAHWLGPLGESLDLWGGQFHGRLKSTLSMQPSRYLARNVRVTPFVFEPVDRYVKQYPELARCYCYSTDYPHREGGRESKQRFYERLAPLGESAVRDFFIRNAEWLMPAGS